MKNERQMKRRSFLGGATAAMGLSPWLGGLMTAGVVFGADAPPGAGKRDAAVLDKLMAELEAQGRQFLSVPRKDGQFLKLLVKVVRAQRVLEVGTSQGYSSLWISSALEETGGHLTTLEIKPERVRMAKDHLQRGGLAHRVTFLEGDAHRLLPSIEGTFDFVFLDADKEGQMDYFQKVYPKKLVPGGLLVVHNAIRLRQDMGDFLELIAKHPDFDAVVLSLTMEDGFSVNYRHRA